MIQTAGSTTDRRGLSVKEAARYLGIGTTTFYKLVREERIRVVKFGMRTIVPHAEIDRLLNGTERPPAPLDSTNRDA